MKRIFIVYGILLLIANIVQAQNKAIDSINKLDEVVISAQYAPTTEKNAVYKVKVINSKMIESKSATNLTELLRQELNVDFSFNPVFGAGIELNGVSKENIKILIDGVPLIGRVNGVLNLNQINLENLERIEVIEGPVSVFYGTDALGGIINLITKKSQKKSVSGSLSGYYESVDAKQTDATMGFKQGKNTFQFGAGYYYFNGLNTDDEYKRTLNWSKKQQYYKHFNYLRDLGAFKLRFSSDFSEELVHTLGEIKRGKATDIDYTTRRFDNSLNFQGKLKNNRFIDVSASYLNYDRFDTSYKFIPTDNSVTLIENNPNENGNYFDTFYAKVHYAKSDFNNKLNYAFGVAYNSETGKGNRILNDKKNIQSASIYTSLNYKITTNFEIQPAVRYTNNSSFDGLWSPALNLKYRLNDNNVIRLAYGKGYRAPSIKELYLDWTPTFGPITYTFAGNENLELESSNSYNVHYTYTKYVNNGNQLQIEPAVFYNEVKNLIGLSELHLFERHYINLNETKNITTSINASYKTDALKANLGFSYLGRYLEYTDEFNSDTFMFSPAVNASLTYDVASIGLSANLFYKYTGKRDGHFIDNSSDTDVLTATTREDFSNLDINVSKSFFNKLLTVSIGAKNIFDVTDIETTNQIGVAHERDIQLWGKSYYLKSIIKF
jgi:outer membrane receptor for ferrienterochelin and colicins